MTYILLAAAGGISDSVIVAVVTGVLSILGIIITNTSANRKIEHKLETAQEVTNNEIRHLTEEVRKHNSFAERIPIVETELRECERRIGKLEAKS